jgi:hypothetical protein
MQAASGEARNRTGRTMAAPGQVGLVGAQAIFGELAHKLYDIN